MMKPLIQAGAMAIAAAALLFTSCHKDSGIPKYEHVVVVIEENHGFEEVIGATEAPYINELAAGGALFTDSHGVMHPSEPNYLAIFSGSTHGVTDDTCFTNTPQFNTPNLGASLIDNGYTFAGYAQTMPSVGYTDCKYQKSDLTVGYLYARKHCPWVNWQGTGANHIPASVSHPMTDFPTDFSQLPTVAFVIPDMDHDMHNIGAPGDSAAIKRGDDWLKQNISAYATWAKTHNSLLIVTFDEDDSRTTQNHIPTLFYGAHVVNRKYPETINHYSVLHTIEMMYHLHESDTTRAEPITDVWKK